MIVDRTFPFFLLFFFRLSGGEALFFFFLLSSLHSGDTRLQKKKKTVITSLFNKLTSFFPLLFRFLACGKKVPWSFPSFFLMEGCAKSKHFFFFLRLLLVDAHSRKKDHLSRLFEKLVMPAVVCVDCAPQKQNV